MIQNLDPSTVAGFGDEWAEYDQTGAGEGELEEIFHLYFSEFPWESLPEDAVGFDLGCGSGRWARFVAPRVGKLHCIDASDKALAVARRNLAGQSQCEFHHASVDQIPLADDSMDFGYSLGVLHHVPNTEAGIRSCVSKLKKGAPFLLYLYYRFDNRPRWYQALWHASEIFRGAISRLPHRAKVPVTRFIAGFVYFPVARSSAVLEKMGINVEGVPLSAYRHSSYYTMKTDALDRFGTRLEQRFTAAEIRGMMERAGLGGIRFRQHEPYWCAVGERSGD